jgi:hypothetical protein
MSVGRVLAMLGPPIEVSTQAWSEVWCYRPAHRKFIEPRGRKGDVFVYRVNAYGKFTRLHFAESGTVLNSSGDYLSGTMVGLKKSDVIAAYGEPDERELTPSAVVYHYSRPGKSGTYKIRQVLLDRADIVLSTVREIYYD